MQNKLSIVTIQFANEIDSRRLVQFRGAIIASLKEKNILFHNHEDDKLRYAYPLIQYKRIHKKAAVVGVGKGVEVISHLLDSDSFCLQIGKEAIDMRIEAVNVYNCNITLTEGTNFRYRLRGWLPLNSKNYPQYQNSESLVERITILEEVLIGNILSFLKGIDIRIEEQIRLHITDITDQRNMIYKKVKLQAFDVEFKTNIALPQYIGLGKSASVGCGVLTKITN